MSIQTSNIEVIASELNSMLNDYIVDHGMFVPIKKNLIKYKNYTLQRANNESWSIFCNKRLISETFLKSSAFVFCKLHESNNVKLLKDLVKHDKDFKKHFIDSKQFEYTIKESQDEITRDAAICRYDISSKQAERVRKKINNMLYRLIV